MPKIFIAYRRCDSQEATGRLYDRLVAQFGNESVFRDIDAIPIGVEYPSYLESVVSEMDVVLVIIGPNWLNACNEDGERRLDDPCDFVRLEIENAFNFNVPVVPIAVSNAVLPNRRELPDTLVGITLRQGLSVRPDPDFHTDVDRLIAKLQRLSVGGRAAPDVGNSNEIAVELDDALETTNNLPPTDEEKPSDGSKHSCQYCISKIPARATKCPYCHEYLVESDRLTAANYALAILLAPLAVCTGLAWLVKRRSKAWRILLISIPISLLWVAAFVIVAKYVPIKKDQTEFHDRRISEERPENELAASDLPRLIDLATQDLIKIENGPEEVRQAVQATAWIVLPDDTTIPGVIFEVKGEVAKILTTRYYFARDAVARTENRFPMVYYSTGVSEPGKLVWIRRDWDLAVVRAFCPTEGVNEATWDSTPQVDPGSDVFSIGAPTVRGWTVERGKICTPSRQGTDSVDVAICVDNEFRSIGGGLFDANGKLLGINTYVQHPRAWTVAIRFHEFMRIYSSEHGTVAQ